MVTTQHGVHLTRTASADAEVEALAEALGGRASWPGFLEDLGRRGRRTVAPGLGARTGFTWDRADRRDRRWWPQGVTLAPPEAVGGRRVLLVAWYAKEQPGDPAGGLGVRISVIDLTRRRYRHVLLVEPRLQDGVPGVRPVKVHAGGLAWVGPYLYVAGTKRGLLVAHLADLLRVPDQAGPDRAGPDQWGPIDTSGHRYLLPIRFRLKAGTEAGTEPFRYSFVSHHGTGELAVGEYGGTDKTRRLALFAIDPETSLPTTDDDGKARPQVCHEDGPTRMQGVVHDNGRWFVTCSQGPWVPGSLRVGRPGSWRHRRFATPSGPEDITMDPQTGRLWSTTEHPRRRWVFSIRA